MALRALNKAAGARGRGGEPGQTGTPTRALCGFNTKEAKAGKTGTEGRVEKGARVCLGLFPAENPMKAGQRA